MSPKRVSQRWPKQPTTKVVKSAHRKSRFLTASVSDPTRTRSISLSQSHPIFGSKTYKMPKGFLIRKDSSSPMGLLYAGDEQIDKETILETNFILKNKIERKWPWSNQKVRNPRLWPQFAQFGRCFFKFPASEGSFLSPKTRKRQLFQTVR